MPLLPRMLAALRATLVVASVLTVSIAIALAFSLAAGFMLYWIVKPILIDYHATGTVVVAACTLLAVSTVRYVAIWGLSVMGVLVPADGTAEEPASIKLYCYANVAGLLLGLMLVLFLEPRTHVLVKCEVGLISILWAWFFARDFAEKASSLCWARTSEDGDGQQHEHGRRGESSSS